MLSAVCQTMLFGTIAPAQSTCYTNGNYSLLNAVFSQEELMLRRILTSAAILTLLAVLIIGATSCFGSSGSNATPTTSSNEAVKPKPSVQKVVASTSGTENAYYATLDIGVKNDGAEGTILVVGSVTQGGKTSQTEMPVFLQQGQSHELKLTFPLVWKGGEFTQSVQTIIP